MEVRMRFKRTAGTIAVIIATLVTVTACKKAEGPAEKAGRELDNAVTKAGAKVNEAMETAGKKMEKAGEEIQDATTRTENK